MPRCGPQQWLLGQKALVTGASSGIGRATAMALAASGADVVVDFVGPEEPAREVAAAIEVVGRRAFVYKADVANEAEVERMFAASLDEFGTIDILVNNAGIQQDAPFESTVSACSSTAV